MQNDRFTNAERTLFRRLPRPPNSLQQRPFFPLRTRRIPHNHYAISCQATKGIELKYIILEENYDSNRYSYICKGLRYHADH